MTCYYRRLHISGTNQTLASLRIGRWLARRRLGAAPICALVASGPAITMRLERLGPHAAESACRRQRPIAGGAGVGVHPQHIARGAAARQGRASALGGALRRRPRLRRPACLRPGGAPEHDP